MKLNIFLVTYEGEKRKEERWEDISSERKKDIANTLNDKFMRTAGFHMAEAPG